MLKRYELELPASCLNQADFDEPIFVLRANDELAPEIIREWARRYFQSKLTVHIGGDVNIDYNKVEKYDEAMKLADIMYEWRINKNE